ARRTPVASCGPCGPGDETVPCLAGPSATFLDFSVVGAFARLSQHDQRQVGLVFVHPPRLLLLVPRGFGEPLHLLRYFGPLGGSHVGAVFLLPSDGGGVVDIKGLFGHLGLLGCAWW